MCQFSSWTQGTLQKQHLPKGWRRALTGDAPTNPPLEAKADGCLRLLPRHCWAVGRRGRRRVETTPARRRNRSPAGWEERLQRIRHFGWRHGRLLGTSCSGWCGCTPFLQSVWFMAILQQPTQDTRQDRKVKKEKKGCVSVLVRTCVWRTCDVKLCLHRRNCKLLKTTFAVSLLRFLCKSKGREWCVKAELKKVQDLIKIICT